VSFSCSEVAVNSVTVLSQTKLIASVSIDADAPMQICDVSVKTGNQLVVRRSCFQILSSWCICSSLEPSFIRAPGTEKITITAGCEMFTAHADIAVSVGCSGVSATNISVLSSADLTVDISADITAPYCMGDVTIRSDNLTVACTSALEIFEAECEVAAVAPDTLYAGVILPRVRVVDATLSQPSAGSVSDIIFDSDDRSLRVLYTHPVSESVIRMLLYIPPLSEPGSYPFTIAAGEILFTGGEIILQ
jgi:hypothetical protein